MFTNHCDEGLSQRLSAACQSTAGRLPQATHAADGTRALLCGRFNDAGNDEGAARTHMMKMYARYLRTTTRALTLSILNLRTCKPGGLAGWNPSVKSAVSVTGTLANGAAGQEAHSELF